jgi:hypothetical protein
VGTSVCFLTAQHIIRFPFLFDVIFLEHKTLNNLGWYVLQLLSFTHAANHADTIAVAIFLASQVITRFIIHLASEG